MLSLWEETAPPAASAGPLKENVRADVVVIGGGYTGLSAALHLAQSGVDVRLLEAHRLGHGGSGRNVGLVNAGLWTPPDEIEALVGTEQGKRLNDMLGRAPDLVFALIEQFGIDCESTRNGTLHLAHSERGWRELKNRYDQQVRRNAPVSLLDADEAMRRTGSRAYRGALHDARAGTIQPLAYVHGLARQAAAAGAFVHQYTPALRLTRGSGEWHVETPVGMVTARCLIHATNAYDTGLAAQAYTSVYYFQFATAPLPPEQLRQVLPGREGCWDTALVMSSFRLDGAGRLVIGAVGNLDGPRLSVHRRWARRKLGTLFPALADLPLEHGWHGRIAMTSDHLPRVSFFEEGAVSIYGYNGRGIGPGTMFGKCAAEWATSGDPGHFPLEPSTTRTSRFAPAKAAWYDAGSLAAHLVGARMRPKPGP